MQSICGVLNNILAYKKKLGDDCLIGQLPQKLITDKQIEAKELLNVIVKAEKINKGQF